MSKMDLKLGKSTKEDYTAEKHFENNYKLWRKHRKELSEPFFMVPSEIRHYVSSIKSKAISLYLYYCYRANNNSGKSWASVERTAEDLGISTKSVNNWNNELESLGLITRISEGRSSKTTYLLPISDYYYFEKNVTPTKFIEFSEEQIDGEILCVLHLFQWTKGKQEENAEPYNVTCLIFQRSYEPDGTSNNKPKFLITKAVFFEEEEDKNIRINKNIGDFSDEQPAYVFETSQRLFPFSIPSFGIAVSNKINLKDTKKSKEVLDLVQQLAQGVKTDTIKDLPTAEIIESE